MKKNSYSYSLLILWHDTTMLNTYLVKFLGGKLPPPPHPPLDETLVIVLHLYYQLHVTNLNTNAGQMHFILSETGKFHEP